MDEWIPPSEELVVAFSRRFETRFLGCDGDAILRQAFSWSLQARLLRGKRSLSQDLSDAKRTICACRKLFRAAFQAACKGEESRARAARAIFDLTRSIAACVDCVCRFQQEPCVLLLRCACIQEAFARAGACVSGICANGGTTGGTTGAPNDLDTRAVRKLAGALLLRAARRPVSGAVAAP